MPRPTDEDLIAVGQRAQVLAQSFSSWDVPYRDAALSVATIIEEIRSLRSDLAELQTEVAALADAVNVGRRPTAQESPDAK